MHMRHGIVKSKWRSLLWCDHARDIILLLVIQVMGFWYCMYPIPGYIQYNTGALCISHSRPRPVQELPTMCGRCGKIPDAVMTDVRASCWRSNVSFSQARSSIGILPILENVLFDSSCRRMHSRIAWYVAEVNSEYPGLFQRVTRSAILSVGNQLELLVCAWSISRRLSKRRCSVLSELIVGVKLLRISSGW